MSIERVISIGDKVKRINGRGLQEMQTGHVIERRIRDRSRNGVVLSSYYQVRVRWEISNGKIIRTWIAETEVQHA